jgi:transposase
MELWIGDAAEIQTKRVRKPKTDREDARLLLRLLLEDRFPRIWVPSWENRDLNCCGTGTAWCRRAPGS